MSNIIRSCRCSQDALTKESGEPTTLRNTATSSSCREKTSSTFSRTETRSLFSDLLSARLSKRILPVRSLEPLQPVTCHVLTKRGRKRKYTEVFTERTSLSIEVKRCRKTRISFKTNTKYKATAVKSKDNQVNTRHYLNLRSANKNKNNDNSTICESRDGPPLEEDHFKNLLFLPNNGDQGLPVDPVSLLHIERLAVEHQDLPSIRDQDSLNTNPLSLSGPTAARSFLAVGKTAGELENLTKERINSAKHKRRFCDSHFCWFERNRPFDSSIQHLLLAPEEEQELELPSSPPCRIPRLLRRSQSAFCQARDLIESQPYATERFLPLFRRYNSYTESKDCSYFPGFESSAATSIVDQTFYPRLSSTPSSAGISAETAFLSVLNCNANATTAVLQTKHQDIIPADIGLQRGDSGFSEFLDSSPVDSSDQVPWTTSPTESVKQKVLNLELLIKNHSKQLEKFSQNQPRVHVKESPLASNGFLGELQRKIEVCQERELTDSLCRACLKQHLLTQKKLSAFNRLDNSRRLNEVDQEIAASVHCFCRISSLEDQHIGKSSREISLVNKESHFQKVHSTKLAEGESFYSKAAIAEVFKKSNDYFLRKKESAESFQLKSLSSGLPETRRKFCHSNPSFLDFSEYKRALQTSANNHNTTKEILLRGAESHKTESDYKKTLSFILGGAHSLHNTNGDHVRRQRNSTNTAGSVRNNVQVIPTPPYSEMGCIHSVSQKKRVEPCRNSIYCDVRATIDQSPTIIEEYSPIVLRYRTPYFRAHAEVVMPPIRNKETWTVGWIQACDYMKFINQYGNLGSSSWEIPALKSGKIPAVSDSDGVSYPWYGNTTEIATIVGPTDTYRRMNLTMNDNFYPSVTWDIPVSEGTNAHLTQIVRDQSFITWLAAINETTKQIIVLKTVRWKFYLDIRIDPTRELGQRARIVAPLVQRQPLVTSGPCERTMIYNSSPVRRRRRGNSMDNNSNSNSVDRIPISALVRPSANNAQTLIWRPMDTNPVVVVPPKEDHKDTNELVLFNGCSAMHGKESIIREISKQELIKLQQLTT